MNPVVDDAFEVLIKKETRSAVTRMLLKGLIHVREKLAIQFHRYCESHTSQDTLGDRPIAGTHIERVLLFDTVLVWHLLQKGDATVAYKACHHHACKLAGRA